MITYESTMVNDKEDKFAFSGLSTDTKPTVSQDGRKIYNGSSFFEINTHKAFFYDASTNTWK